MVQYNIFYNLAHVGQFKIAQRISKANIFEKVFFTNLKNPFSHDVINEADDVSGRLKPGG